MEEAGGPAQQEMHGDQNAISMYGDASVHLHPPPISSVLPERVWMVPYRRNSFFTGRERLLSALHDRFTTDRAAVLTQGQAISGLGGIGKTQVAVEYAYRHQEDYRFVFWVNATTPTTLITNFATLADRLQLPERVLPEQEKVVAAVLQWLATHQGWLLIVDNADELEQVWPALPTGSTGHVLLTTRDQMVGDFERFQVEELDRAEGVQLLVRRAHLLKPGMVLEQVSSVDRQVAEQIVIAMDGLPLALDQAGAYIEETRCSLSDYWRRYQQQRSVLLGHRGRSGRAYHAPVDTTWSLSFQQVERRSAAAAALLSLCAYLSAEAIPEAIITEGASQLGEPWQAVGQDQGQLDEAIGVLRAYSLLRRNPEEHTLSVHRLVQAVLRDGMDGTARRSWAEQAVQAVNGAFPVVEHHSWPQCDRLLPHALQCVTWIEQERITVPAAARLLNQTGFYLKQRARYPEAEPLYERALAIREQQLGPQHPDTASSLNNLAALYDTQGKYEQAEPLLVRALAIREQQLGPQHPDTASSLNNLAYLYDTQGKYEQAEPLLVRALAIYEQQLGTTHPRTRVIRGNYVSLRQTMERNEAATRLERNQTPSA